MINIPKNTPRKQAAKPAADSRDRLVKRALDAFASGRSSVTLGGWGGNGASESDARAVGRAFVDKGYFASLIYSVDGKFRSLVVSTTQLSGCSSPGDTTRKVIGQKHSPAPEPECDVWSYSASDDDDANAGLEKAAVGLEPDVFAFNGEAVTIVSDPSKPYAIYRRDYPHKPKWLVADKERRVVALIPYRAHAQAVVDELNNLAAK